MYNTSQYNSATYNASPLYSTTESQDDIVFNSYGLQNAQVVTQKKVNENMPTRDLLTFSRPRTHGKGVVSDFFREKYISIEGTLKAATCSELNDAIDEMKKALREREGILDIKINGIIRRFVATLQNTDGIYNRERYNLTFIKYKLLFVCYEPFGQDVEFSSVAELGQVSKDLLYQVENQGTVEANPSIHLLLSTVNSISKVEIENQTTNEIISITRTFASGDVIQIDSEEKTVLVNGAVSDYTGVFPQLETGVNTFNIVFTGTSVAYNITTKYKKTYL